MHSAHWQVLGGSCSCSRGRLWIAVLLLIIKNKMVTCAANLHHPVVQVSKYSRVLDGAGYDVRHCPTGLHLGRIGAAIQQGIVDLRPARRQSYLNEVLRMSDWQLADEQLSLLGTSLGYWCLRFTFIAL